MFTNIRSSWRFYFDIVLSAFFIFLAVQLLPVRGWDFTTIFCCVFASISLGNVIGLMIAWIRMYRERKKSYEYYKRLNEDPEFRAEMEELARKMTEEVFPTLKEDANHPTSKDETSDKEDDQ